MATKQNTSLTEPKETDEQCTDEFSEEERAYIDAKLRAAEESIKKHGLIEETAEEMLARFKAKARRNGKL